MSAFPLPVTCERKMAARGGKRAAERAAQNKTKRAKLNGNKSPQTERKAKTVSFTSAKEEEANKNIISVPPPVSTVNTHLHLS